MTRHCTRFGLLVALLSWAAPMHARAYDEQISLDLGAGYSALSGPSRDTTQGPLAEVGVGVGLAHSFALRGNVAYAALVDRDPPPHLHRVESFGRFRIEALYQLDVLKIVPFFGLGGTVGTAQDGTHDGPVRAGAHVVLGADYLVSRSWILGLDLRTALLARGGALSNVTDVSLRVSRMFETF